MATWFATIKPASFYMLATDWKVYARLLFCTILMKNIITAKQDKCPCRRCCQTNIQHVWHFPHTLWHLICHIYFRSQSWNSFYFMHLSIFHVFLISSSVWHHGAFTMPHILARLKCLLSWRLWLVAGPFDGPQHYKTWQKIKLQHFL